MAAGTKQMYAGMAYGGLERVAKYHAADLIEGHRRIVAALERHRRS